MWQGPVPHSTPTALQLCSALLKMGTQKVEEPPEESLAAVAGGSVGAGMRVALAAWRAARAAMVRLPAES